MIWWIIWAALQAGIFVLYRFLSASAQTPHTPDTSYSWLAALIPLTISAVFRWIVLPRMKTSEAAFPVFVSGMAAAEATCFIGIFIFPAQKQELFLLSVLGILQFIPLFARRFSQT